MIISKEVMEKELLALAGRAFSMPEVQRIRIRGEVLQRGETLAERVKEAVDISWHDCMSDVDLCMDVYINIDSHVTDEGYMARLDRFGLSRNICLGRSFIPENKMWRVVMKNGMRYDIGFTFEYDDNGPMLPMLLWPEEEKEESWPQEKSDRFWFIQVQALGKLFRRDYLIADHLAHMCLNETLEQQMVLRDREKGTNHHRYGDGEDRAYEKYLDKCPLLTGNESHDRIARKLYAAAVAYDEMMTGFCPEWEKKTPVLTEIWQCYAQGAEREAVPETVQPVRYCAHCSRVTNEETCPECGRPCHPAKEEDIVFLLEKAHPWSDMLADVLAQNGIPCLRQGNLGAGMGMIVGHYMNVESLYVPYGRLQEAAKIADDLFGKE